MGILGSILSVVGGPIGRAVNESSATKKATKDQIAAQQQALAAQEAAAAKVQGLYAPGQAAYGNGLNALTNRLGVPQAAPTAYGSQPVAAPSSGGNALLGVAPGGAYGNPAATYDSTVMDTFAPPTGRDTAGGKPADPMASAMGYKAASAATGPTGTYAPGTQPAAPQPSAAGAPMPTSGGVDPGTYGTGATGANPSYTAPTYQAPPAYQAPASYQAPTYQDPGNFSYTLDDYKASPGYAYQVDQAQKGIMATSAATGALQSGAALKELQDRSQNLAYQDFTNERAFAANQFDQNRAYDRANYQDDRNFGYGQSVDDRNFGYNAYTDSRNFGRATYDSDRAYNQNAYQDERNYLTNRYDTQTNNLFRYTGIGDSAMQNVANSYNQVGNAQANAATNTGYLSAGNALKQASIYGNLGQTLDNAATMFAY